MTLADEIEPPLEIEPPWGNWGHYLIREDLDYCQDSSDLDYIVNNNNSDDFLKNIVIKSEIVTEKKYISDIDIFFDKKKIINLFKLNN